MKPKVYIVSNYHPFYKLPLLRALAKDNEIDYYFISGLEADITINNLSEEILLQNHLQWMGVKNYWLFRKRMLWQKGVLKSAASGNYDCIVFLANPYYITNWLGILIAHLRKKKIALWGHFTLRNSRLDPIKTFFYGLADGCLLYGNWAKQQLIERGFSPDRLFVVYNSLDYEHQIECRRTITHEKRNIRRQTSFKSSDLPILLFIGRLTRRKKLNLLIEAAAKLHVKHLPVNMLLIGDGEEKDSLVNLVNFFGLNDFVVFYGETYDEEELAELISLSDVCVSPGEVGLNAIHALVYGTPVITHNNPCEQGPEFEAIKPGISGAFFEIGSIDSLTEVIYQWLVTKNFQRETVRADCYRVIDQLYNPQNQATAIKSAIIKTMNISSRI